jgi:hypothetical protein
LLFLPEKFIAARWWVSPYTFDRATRLLLAACHRLTVLAAPSSWAIDQSAELVSLQGVHLASRIKLREILK